MTEASRHRGGALGGPRAVATPATPIARRGAAIAALACIALLLAPVAPARAKARRPRALSGTWRLDPSRTETPARAGGHAAPGEGPGRGGFGGRGPRGGWGGGMGGGMEGRRRGGEEMESWRRDGARPSPLPPLLRIAATDTSVRLADSSGVEVAEIEILPRAAATADTGAALFAAPRFGGAWKGSKLVVERELPNGFTITDTWSLKQKDRELEVLSVVRPPSGSLERDFRRVYERVGD